MHERANISERPTAVDQRRELGHWEMDTVISSATNDCILTLVERLTGCVLIAKLPLETLPPSTDACCRSLPRAHTCSAPLRSTTGPSSTPTSRSNASPACSSTSLPHITPGNAEPTRTPTASFASTCRNVPP